jgi:phosphoserine phosphatase RsbU/P
MQFEDPVLPDAAEAYDFLEKLVDMVARGWRHPRPLPQWIGEEMARIIAAEGSAIYLVDSQHLQLLPHWVSQNFPALIPLESAVGNLAVLRSTPAPMDAGVLAKCFQEEEMHNLAASNDHGPLLLSPLKYGNRTLGILALSRPTKQSGFDGLAVTRFHGLAAQVGFALGSALMRDDATEKRRMDSELRSAREVQRLLLPDTDPTVPGYEIAGKNLAARVLSGDYYDYLPVDTGHFGVVIADVSGKGTPASLVMATCRGLLRGLAGRETSPSKALSQVNRQIYEDMKENMFISAAYIMLEPTSGYVTLCRAGHDAPLLWRKATGTVTKLDTAGMALGLDDGEVFDRAAEDHRFQMEPGDTLLLYTDGVNEAESESETQYGLDTLCTAFSEAAPHGPANVITHLLKALARHMGNASQSDDITMVVIQKS